MVMAHGCPPNLCQDIYNVCWAALQVSKRLYSATLVVDHFDICIWMFPVDFVWHNCMNLNVLQKEISITKLATVLRSMNFSGASVDVLENVFWWAMTQGFVQWDLNRWVWPVIDITNSLSISSLCIVFTQHLPMRWRMFWWWMVSMIWYHSCRLLWLEVSSESALRTRLVRCVEEMLKEGLVRITLHALSWLHLTVSDAQVNRSTLLETGEIELLEEAGIVGTSSDWESRESSVQHLLQYPKYWP